MTRAEAEQIIINWVPGKGRTEKDRDRIAEAIRTTGYNVIGIINEDFRR